MPLELTALILIVAIGVFIAFRRRRKASVERASDAARKAVESRLPHREDADHDDAPRA